MFVIHKENSDDEEIFNYTFSLYKDGIEYNDIVVNKIYNEFEESEDEDEDEDEVFEIVSTTVEMGRKLLDFSFFQFPNNASLVIELKENWYGFALSLRLKFTEYIGNGQVTIKLIPILEEWKLPYSFDEYRRTFFGKVFADFSVTKISDSEIANIIEHYNKSSFMVSNKIGYLGRSQEVAISFNHNFSFTTIKNEVNEYVEICERLHSETSELLKLNYDGRKITAIFEFPEKIKIPCEQYLLYFAQFLQDLGINTTSNFKEEAGKVLFSITPTEDVEALNKIREALAVYLNLPSRPIVYDESFAAMRLKQQVDNLQHAQRMTEMEFRLAHKVIESQDKIIQQKDSTIEQQSKIIEKFTNKAVMIDSAENKEELEELFDGVKIGKSKFLAEQIGLHLNPATALKSVGKKLIGKDGEIVSLNLNDEVDSKDI